MNKIKKKCIVRKEVNHISTSATHSDFAFFYLSLMMAHSFSMKMRADLFYDVPTSTTCILSTFPFVIQIYYDF